jgi:hypothetical protein
MIFADETVLVAFLLTHDLALCCVSCRTPMNGVIGE